MQKEPVAIDKPPPERDRAKQDAGDSQQITLERGSQIGRVTAVGSHDAQVPRLHRQRLATMGPAPDEIGAAEDEEKCL